MSHMESFGVGTAVILLKKGSKVRRKGWNGWLEMGTDGTIRLRNNVGVDTLWNPVQADLLLVDWNIVEQENK